MHFAFTDEQEQLRDIARRFLNAESDPMSVRRAMATEDGFDRDIWSRVGSELGWTALAIPEACGGYGFGFVEVVAVAEEMGRALFCAPFLASVGLAANVVLEAGDDEQRRRILPALADGSRIATLALCEGSGQWSSSGLQATADRDSDSWILNGRKRYVPWGAAADQILVVANTSDGPGVFLVDSDTQGLRIDPTPTMDQTRPQAEIVLDDVRCSNDDVIGAPGDAAIAAVDTALDLARVILAAEQVGGAQACLDMAVEYAKVREQFGQPIGRFQAIKHKCADMMIALEAARSAAWYAGWVAANRRAELPEAAAMAQATCSRTYFHCAADNIQIHGGIGFTWEHDAHLYFKRARSSEILFGDPSTNRDRFADAVGL